ncbi:glycosyltransferase [Clostridium beijerinckii]|uniref:glycosyltransferase n=1 Tax=Clostridium beijerinckii TaxID=1520 RepID=UPI002226B51B|nr:glycosyltransferase [Clostridium beijerinckii]UYZ34254.1 glycosyltransferase [Clostridium beijerinckii]
MKIVQVSNCDLAGRKFNGYDLHNSLNELGHQTYQLILEKASRDSTVVQLCSPHSLFIRGILKNLEYQLSMANLIYPFGKSLVEEQCFKDADIVHYHLIHNHFISILDLPNLASIKPLVWTIHDPWVITGHCIHPLECMNWKNGCINCTKLNDAVLPIKDDKAFQMWEIKKNVYKNLDVDIVVASKFMEDYIRNSPLTENFRNIHKIPFGVSIESFNNLNKEDARRKFNISDTSFVIAFRSDSNEIKGLKYIIEMLNKLTLYSNVVILTVGVELLPEYLKEKYRVVELGWQNDLTVLYDFYAACDVFLMPSLAESFGMMAIEAMASARPVIVFENTVLSEITFAPECGIAVPYKNSDMLKDSVEQLMKKPDECRWRGKKGRELVEKYYKYEDYVNSHINLYKEILKRKGIFK